MKSSKVIQLNHDKRFDGIRKCYQIGILQKSIAVLKIKVKRTLIAT